MAIQEEKGRSALINSFLEDLNWRMTKIYGTEIPEAISKHLNQEIAYLQAVPENKLTVYLTILDAVSHCSHPTNSPTPYQPCLIAYLYGLVKTDPVNIVPPEMSLAYPLNIYFETCNLSDAFIMDEIKKRFGEEKLIIHPQTENLIHVLFDDRTINKKKAMENRHGLLYEADLEESDKAVQVTLLRHPLLEAAYAALEEMPLSAILDEKVFEDLIERGCIGGFNGDAVHKTMKMLQPRDIVTLARAVQIGNWHLTDSSRIFAFREDVYYALIENGMSSSDAARLARNLDQARQPRADKEMELLIKHVDQQFLDDCFQVHFRPSLLSFIGAAYYALALSKLRMENPDKYEDLAKAYRLNYD